MEIIDRNLRTYRGIIHTAKTRASGIRALIAKGEVSDALKARGVGDSDAKRLEDAAATLATGVEQLRGLWAKFQEVSAQLQKQRAALASDIRGVEDASRAALGRQSAHLPMLGISPIGRPSKHNKSN